MLNINRNLIIKLFSKYSKTLDLINKNAQFFKFMKDDPAEININGNRFEIYDSIISQLNGPIDYLEFGVFKGETIKYWSEKIETQNSMFFGFDSFEGLPDDYESDLPKGSFNTDGIMPQTDDQRVHFIKGWFNDTLPKFLNSYTSTNQKIIHIDSDLYSSALYVLTQLHRFLKKGDIIIFDEFGSLLHEFKAWQDYILAYKTKYKVKVQYRKYIKIAVEITN